MKRVLVVGLALAFVLVAVSLSQAALKGNMMQLKVGDEVYVCGCGPKCDCLTMSKKPGKCSCDKDLVKAKVTKVAKGKATVMMPDGKEQIFPLSRDAHADVGYLDAFPFAAASNLDAFCDATAPYLDTFPVGVAANPDVLSNATAS